MRDQILRLFMAFIIGTASTSALASLIVSRLVEYTTGIDPTRVALLPGESSNRLNYINSLGGITNVLIDIDGAPAPGDIGLDDLNFRIGNTVDISLWSAPVQAPSFSMVSGGGAGGSDRLYLSWPTGAIENLWLEVRVEATSDTGLSAADVFYFGHMFGDINRDGELSPIDSLLIINELNQSGPYPVGADSPYDVDRDGMVTSQDSLLVINELNAGAPARLVALSPPLPGVPLPASIWLMLSGILGGLGIKLCKR